MAIVLELTQRNVALGRMAAGAAYVAFPRFLAKSWTGMGDRRVDALARAIGVRDLALGLGAFVALQRELPARGWFEAAALCNAVDAAATVLVFRTCRDSSVGWSSPPLSLGLPRVPGWRRAKADRPYGAGNSRSSSAWRSASE